MMFMIQNIKMTFQHMIKVLLYQMGVNNLGTDCDKINMSREGRKNRESLCK
jgi:hypothetical protein